MDNTEHELISALHEMLDDLKSNKPNDRSEKDRHYAVVITEMEKVVAYYYAFVLMGI